MCPNRGGGGGGVGNLTQQVCLLLLHLLLFDTLLEISELRFRLHLLVPWGTETSSTLSLGTPLSLLKTVPGTWGLTSQFPGR